jgi:hypothetical protein
MPWYVHRRYRTSEEPLAGLVSVGGPFGRRDDAEWMRSRWPLDAPANKAYVDEEPFPEPAGTADRVWVVAATDPKLAERFPDYVFKVGPFASRKQGQRWIDEVSLAIVEAVPWMFSGTGGWTTTFEADLRTIR